MRLRFDPDYGRWQLDFNNKAFSLNVLNPHCFCPNGFEARQ
jgi:hypothetical protein